MRVQIAYAFDDGSPVNGAHASRDECLQVQANAAFLMAGDVLAVIVYRGRTDGPALDDGTGAIGQGLVELVD